MIDTLVYLLTIPFQFVWEIFIELLYPVLEFILYALVDQIAKNYLQTARDAGEKQYIWVKECITLSFLCFIVWFHHFPYVLLLLASCTCLYIIVVGRVDLSGVSSKLTDIYQDFREHEDSLMEFSDKPVPIDPPVLHPFPPTYPFVPDPSSVPPPNVALDPLVANGTRFIRDLPTGRMVNSQPPVTSSIYPVCVYPAVQQPTVPCPPRLDVGYNPVSARPPIHSSEITARFQGMPTAPYRSINSLATNVEHNSAGFGSAGNAAPVNETNGRSNSLVQPKSSSLLQSVLTTTGLNKLFDNSDKFSNGLPPGLNNSSFKMCFMNCILQVLARTPHLLSSLVATVNATQNSSHVLQELIDIFNKMTLTKPSATGAALFLKSPLQTTNLCRVLSCLPQHNRLIESPANIGRQQLQDSAEFLLWLIDNVHCALSSKQSDASNGFPTGESVLAAKYEKELSLLAMNYNYPEAARIAQIRSQCRQQLSNSDGNDPSTYSLQMETIGDLDWLLYKSTSTSVIDDIFTGQLTTATFCNDCRRISVATDIFRILTVPVPESFQTVNVLDCLNNVTFVEEMGELNQFNCSFCARPAAASTPNAGGIHNGPTPTRVPSQILPADAGLGFLSPIPHENGAVYPAANHIKSTPSPPTRSQFLGNCKRQMLVSRMPDCLVVQLMRFRVVDENPVKVVTKVLVETKLLDLEHLLKKGSCSANDLYELYAVCIHTRGNSTSSGHYMAYVKTSSGWLLFNDDLVSKVNMERELAKVEVQENIYLLFFQRQSFCRLAT